MKIRQMEEAVETNLGKGILFAFGGLVTGFGLWLAVIFIFSGGTGGAIGGGMAAVVGMLIVAGYKKGNGPSGVIGIAIAVIFTIIGVVGAITFGVGIVLYREGLTHAIFDGIDLLFLDFGRRGQLGGLWLREIITMSGIASAMTIWTMISDNKKGKKENLPDLEDLS